MSNRRNKKLLILTLVLIGFICSSLCLFNISYLDPRGDQLSPEEKFSHHLSHPDNDELLQQASDIQVEILSMGQGIYFRFNADKVYTISFLEADKDNPHSIHYPYQVVSCQKFYNAYPAWADTWRGYKWWRPREIVSPECYVTRGCEYFLFNQHSKITYYYFFPDFLGRDHFCVEA